MPLCGALQGTERMECDTADKTMCIRSPISKWKELLQATTLKLTHVSGYRPGLAIKLMPLTTHKKATLPVLRWR